MEAMKSPNLPKPDGVTVVIRDVSGNIMFCWGDTAPSDQETGYATGCLFIKTDDGVIYHNKGSHESADFDALADVS
jgi:hypothetical protein